MEHSIIAQATGVEPVPAVPVAPASGIDMVDAGHAGSEPVPASPIGTGVSKPSEAEQALIREVHELWAAHGELLAEARRSEEEALAILAELGRRLCGAKERLARPGRSGGWSEFARSAGLTRAEADGLVRRHRRTLKPQGTSSIGTENATVTIEGNSAATVAGDCPEAAEEVAAVSVPENAALPTPGEASGAIEEPEVETAATPTETGLSAAPAGIGNGNAV